MKNGVERLNLNREESLKDAGTKLRVGLEELKRVGKADPGQIIIAYNVECLQK